MIRIWNERSQSIGGVGAAPVIATLKANGIHAEQGEAEFANHEGVFVKEDFPLLEQLEILEPGSVRAGHPRHKHHIPFVRHQSVLALQGVAPFTRSAE